MRDADEALRCGHAAAAAAVLLDLYQLTGPLYLEQTRQVRSGRQNLATAVDLARDGVMQRAESHYRAGIGWIFGGRAPDSTLQAVPLGGSARRECGRYTAL